MPEKVTIERWQSKNGRLYDTEAEAEKADEQHDRAIAYQTKIAKMIEKLEGTGFSVGGEIRMPLTCVIEKLFLTASGQEYARVYLSDADCDVISEDESCTIDIPLSHLIRKGWKVSS